MNPIRKLLNLKMGHGNFNVYSDQWDSSDKKVPLQKFFKRLILERKNTLGFGEKNKPFLGFR